MVEISSLLHVLNIMLQLIWHSLSFSQSLRPQGLASGIQDRGVLPRDGSQLESSHLGFARQAQGTFLMLLWGVICTFCDLPNQVSIVGWGWGGAGVGVIFKLESVA